MNKLFIVVGLAILTAGCGVKAQTYVMTRERSDIKPEGNGGFVAGKGVVQEPERKTRKVYILEFTKETPEKEVKKVEQETLTQTTEEVEVPQVSEPAKTSRQMANQRKIELPPIEDEPVTTAPSAKEEEAQGPTVATEYVVQKDDTLQKIAHKFYHSYGKWIKIYEANKDKIKNPNVLRSGTKLTIPAVE